MRRSHSFPLHAAVSAAAAFFVLASGCTRRPTPSVAPPPLVTVSRPSERQVTNYADFTGRTDAEFATVIRPRVTGYLVGMPFKEGAHVLKDQVLFQIDDRPYKAALDLAKATEQAAEAALVKAQAEYDIALAVQKQSKGAVSYRQMVRDLGARDEAKANLERTKASVTSAQLNYDWCSVRSPIDGQVGRFQFTLGNLVNADVTELTTVVSEDPMYVYFDVDENTMLAVLRTVVLPSKEDLLSKPHAVPVFMGLADEPGFPHKGYVNYKSNVVNASTGTILLRGSFDNPATHVDKRLLRPGMFVRVRLPTGKPYRALLVAEAALQSDQGQKYLLVVNDKNVVEYRRVKTGPLQEDGLRVISEGLKPGELVIVEGLQMVRPEMTVKVEEKPMQASPVALPQPTLKIAPNKKG
jgi:membrane fusion protein, multidrug efflux system